jgi:thiol-disulfide isomerase/thioredoxin
MEAKNKLEEAVENAKAISNKRCKEVSIANRGTFTGDIVANVLYVPVSGDYPADDPVQKLSRLDFERKHLLDRLPLGDSRVLLHNGLIRVLNQYTTKFLDADSAAYIVRVLDKRKGNAAVDNWLFKYLFQVSLNYKNDYAMSYLVNWYYNKNLHGPIEVDRSTENLLVAFRNCEAGKTAFNLTLPDAAGRSARIADIAAKNKLTLLLFWRTDCSHCLEFEPELEKLYKQYNSLGLEVIGISMDTDETNWKNHLTANPVSWINLFPPTRDQRIQVISNFPISGTPTVIAVDKDFKVKNRMVIRATIDKYIEEELGK